MRIALALLALSAAAAAHAAEWEAVHLLGESVGPGERARLSWVASESFAGNLIPVPVHVIRGARPGPTLCLTAGVHGDELNGIEVVRRVLLELRADTLSGTVIGVPIVNLHGFRRSSRYLPDRRDLNRYFPGRPNGSSASRIADSLFRQVVSLCDGLVDMHTGSFHRTNIPQLRADLGNAEVYEMARGFGAAVVVHSPGPPGTLRRAAGMAGIPAITYEGGEPMRFERDEVERGVDGVLRLLGSRGMIVTVGDSPDSQEFYHRSRWVRVDDGGILLARIELGDQVGKGDVLGTVTDPVSNETTLVISPYAGRVIGLARNQVVIPGFAAFHLGLPGRELRADELMEVDGADSGDAIDVDERPE